jgi:hypothetical protein
MNKGERHSEKTKRKMSRSHRGVKFDDERKAKIRAGALRYQANRRAMEVRLAELEEASA